MSLPELIITDRAGKASLWVGGLNIWDIPHECVCEDVLSAIRTAYQRGLEEARDQMVKAADDLDTYYLDHAWTDSRREKDEEAE